MNSPYESLIGQRVIVRASMAGVYAGIVAEAHADGVTLAPGARQLHYWSAGGSVPQVAERGIRQAGSRITSPSTYPLILAGRADVVQVVQCTDIAWESIMGAAPWLGGL